MREQDRCQHSSIPIGPLLCPWLFLLTCICLFLHHCLLHSSQEDAEWCDPGGEDGYTDMASGGGYGASSASDAAPGSGLTGDDRSSVTATGGSGTGAGGAEASSSAASRAAAVREACARAMAVLCERYGERAMEGFDGTAHVTVLLDRTMEHRLRHRLLALLTVRGEEHGRGVQRAVWIGSFGVGWNGS